MDLRLRPPKLSDENILDKLDKVWSEETVFLTLFNPSISWADYVELRSNNAKGLMLADGFVPETFLFAVNEENQIVGRSSIRHYLNDFLMKQGGHIGYAVLPEFRRKGYASDILRQSLIIARSLGIEDVLVTCDAENQASRRVIEKCGGIFSDRVADGDKNVLRFWIKYESDLNL